MGRATLAVGIASRRDDIISTLRRARPLGRLSGCCLVLSSAPTSSAPPEGTWQEEVLQAVMRVADGIGMPFDARIGSFVVLLAAIVALVVVVGGKVRRALALRRPAAETAALGLAPVAWRVGDEGVEPLAWFTSLIRQESTGISRSARAGDRGASQAGTPDEQIRFAENAAVEEPRVLFRSADTVGLALSGGGIRSATFNLGFLQGLHQLNLLGLFDYLSTVSGGGYIGAFWSEWLARRQACAATTRRTGDLDSLFPSSRLSQTTAADRVERRQERHVREFSRFLAPRVGFFEVETWMAIVAFAAGLIPSLTTALSFVGMALLAWLLLTLPLASPGRAAADVTIVVVTTAVLLVFEWWGNTWRRRAAAASTLSSRPAENTALARAALARPTARYVLFALAAVGLTLVIQHYAAVAPAAYPCYQCPGTDALEQRADRWWLLIGATPRYPWFWSPGLFTYAVAWLAASALMLVARVGFALAPGIGRRESVAAFDRVTMRLLGLGITWVCIAAVWHIAVNANFVATAAAAAFSAVGFGTLRNWIGLALRRPRETGSLDRVKPLVPPAIAYLTLVLAVAVVGQALVAMCGQVPANWLLAGAVMTVAPVATLFIDPNVYGLHSFYKERLSRAYAGACGALGDVSAAANRSTEPECGDTRPLRTLARRPLHLVCCTANDLGGDPLGNLGRGGRSAVLSRYGLSLGRYWATAQGLTLGSAVTASAAAFNSNMGQISVKLGPAVAFLMTALNLRLGLWLPHPLAASDKPHRWPGVLLFREMFGCTYTSVAIGDPRKVPQSMRDVHLSDGGHFENLALYELVRRHCRYVVVSDCGADPQVAFDDLGNALRRVREDFGVDISIDIEPLRPNAEGWSRQHVAVGTIEYAPMDRGVLLYVKPTLTSDEPPDVLQYRTRNTSFPHESTGDQFYDEAQFESYRRLGAHVADTIFDFARVSPVRQDGEPVSADRVFASAADRWCSTPPGLLERVLQMTERFGQLESELQRRQPPPPMLAEVFPEGAYVRAHVSLDPVPLDPGPHTRVPDRAWDPGVAETAADDADLWCLLRVTQIMEDVWLACDLAHRWNHPLNMGWINLFARWATAPTFQRWWPLLRAMYSNEFATFIEQRFGTPVWHPPARTDMKGTARTTGTVRRAIHPMQGLAGRWWAERAVQPMQFADRQIYEYVLNLPVGGGRVAPLQVALAAVLIDGGCLGWSSDDFFVPPSLWGAGHGSSFLEQLLRTLHRDCAGRDRRLRCYVVIKAPGAHENLRLALDDRRAFLAQYKQMGFRQILFDEPTPTPEADFVRSLGYDYEVGDALLRLELDDWISVSRPHEPVSSGSRHWLPA